MTEAEWLVSGDPRPMLELLRGKMSDRKLRLFAGGCCRRIWPHLTQKRSRWLVEMSDRFADGKVQEKRLASALDKADISYQSVHLRGGGDVDQNPAQAVLGLGVDLQVDEVVEFAAATFGAVARGATYEQIWQSPGKENSERWAEDDAIRSAAEQKEMGAQASIVRDIFGNPFRPMPIAPAWQTGTVVALAQAIYDERAFDRMPILGDALEDAGCDNAEILNHCRQPGEHVRGCWVVDLLLGKK